MIKRDEIVLSNSVFAIINSISNSICRIGSTGRIMEPIVSKIRNFSINFSMKVIFMF